MYLKHDYLPGFAQKIPSKWVCSNCVVTYQYGWFERFTQYEFLVLRSGATAKQFNKWLNNLERDKKFKNKLSIIIKNGRKIIK